MRTASVGDGRLAKRIQRGGGGREEKRRRRRRGEEDETWLAKTLTVDDDCSEFAGLLVTEVVVVTDEGVLISGTTNSCRIELVLFHFTTISANNIIIGPARLKIITRVLIAQKLANQRLS